MNQIFQAKRCYLIGAGKFYWIFHSFGREATGEHLQYARTSYKLYQIFSDHSHWHWRKKTLKLYLVIKLLNWFDFKDWLLPHRQKAPNCAGLRTCSSLSENSTQKLNWVGFNFYIHWFWGYLTNSNWNEMTKVKFFMAACIWWFFIKQSLIRHT